VGGTLTKYITLPIVGITSAAAGMTAAFGWERLVGLDSAQAQLKGLGYSTEEVGRISDQVTSAIEGGMTTMAEGTSIAAGALAAGVEEGAELERYIKLVGDAAVGANRPVGEMAMIFNRVQGSGKLMTQELNMVEEGMPGFSKAMADHLGVAPDKMREMVTAGEVSSDDFLTVMDGFAGGMAAAYSDSWRGMVANTKAYIGIIGENLLSGVFEKSKESIAEFIEFLKSPEVVAWAERMGQVIGTVFSNIIDRIKSAIAWFTQLSGSQQKLIGILAALATAAGPVLMVLGTLGTAVGAFVFYVGSAISTIGRFGLKFQQLGGFAGVLSNIISKVTGFFARFGGVLRTILGPIMPIITKGFTILRTALMALTGPVGIVIGIVSALVAGFVIAYKRSETFRNFIDGLVQSFLNAIQPLIRFKDMIVSVFKAIFNMFTGDMDGGIKMLEALGLQPEQIGRIISTVQQIKAA